MSIENDIQNAIGVLYGNKNKQYKKVRIFPNHSLKHFKKYKLDNKEVLSKVNSIDEILDLLSYNASVTCFSNNSLDRYFLILLSQMHNIDRKKYMDYIFRDYGKNDKILSKKYYDLVRDSLDDRTRYFFDEIYKFCFKTSISMSRLVEKQKYEKRIYDMYVKNYLLGRFDDISKNDKLTYLLLSDDTASEVLYEKNFDFINLSYEIDSKEKIDELLKKEEQYKKLLTDSGKIQLFVSFENYEIKDHKKIDTRSILDPYTNNNDCKKEYAYMYRNSKQ